MERAGRRQGWAKRADSAPFPHPVHHTQPFTEGAGGGRAQGQGKAKQGHREESPFSLHAVHPSRATRSHPSSETRLDLNPSSVAF